jgi:hypothetical protein
MARAQLLLMGGVSAIVAASVIREPSPMKTADVVRSGSEQSVRAMTDQQIYVCISRT